MTNLLNILIITVFLIGFKIVVSGNNYEVYSPDNKIKLQISVENDITWSVFQNNIQLIESSMVSLIINNSVLGKNANVINSNTITENGTINPVVPHKFKNIADDYRQITIDFEKDRDVTSFISKCLEKAEQCC